MPTEKYNRRPMLRTSLSTLLLGGALAATGAACTLSSSLDDLSAGAKAGSAGGGAGGVDSPSGVGGAGGVTSPSGAGGTGGAGGVDAPSGAGGSGAPPITGCAAKVCLNFDGKRLYPDMLFVPSEPPDNEVHGRLRADDTSYESPPKSLVATTIANTVTASDTSFATLRRAFSDEPDDLRLSVDFQPLKDMPDERATVMKVRFNDGDAANAHSVNVYLRNDTSGGTTPRRDMGVEIVYPGPDGDERDDLGAFGEPLPDDLSEWSHIDLHIQLNEQKQVTARLGDKETSFSLTAATWRPAPPTLFIGISYVSDETQEWAMRYDNVAFDYTAPPAARGR